jgi:HlyD family secretion protein
MAAKRTRIIVGIVAVLVVAGIVAVNVIKDRRNRVVVQTQKVERRDLVSTVSASGEIKPRKFVNVGANVSGRIVQLLVKEGDRVKEGQVVARIDSTRIAADLRQSEAGLQAAKADLDRAVAETQVAKLAFERMQRVHQQQLVSDQDFDQSRADFEMKTANVEALRKRMAQQAAVVASRRDDLEKTTVYSPMDGVVTDLPKEEGEVVIGAQSFQPTVIMTIGDLSVIECEVMVDETDISNLKVGQPADIRVDALEGVKITGKVTEIGASAIPRGQTSGATTTANTGNQAKDFKVEVTIQNPPPGIRPGLNAAADITTARKEKVIAVPIQAVVVREMKEGKVVDPGAVSATPSPSASPETIRRRAEEKEGVFVVVNGVAHFRPVKTGIVGETQIEVVDGLKDGEEIVTGSYRTLRTLKDAANVKPETPK